MGRITEEERVSSRSGSVLVVCTANECRSPAAAALLAAALGDDVRVLSAGTRAMPGRPACPEAVGWLTGAGALAVGLGAHASAALDAGSVRDATLVLAASREHRSAAVALVPAVQRRAFTLTQAARLAGRLVTDGVRPAEGLTGIDRLAWWVEELDALRGDVPREAPGDDDLPDPHDGRARHAEVFPRLVAAARAVATLLAPEPATAGITR